MKLAAVDNLSLVFIVGLAGLTLACHALLTSVAGVVIGVLALLAGMILGASWAAPRSAVGDAAHAFLPVLLILVLFNTLGPIIDCVNPARWDATFAAVDARLFGEAAARWHQTLGRPWWLTDLTYLLYVSYYLLPVALAVALYGQRRWQDFDELVFGVVTCFYLSYVGYLFFPTVGPRIPAEAEAARLGGGLVSEAIRVFLHFAERTSTDAFPSGHAAVALVCLYFGWRMVPSQRWTLALWVSGIIFTTVYLHYHYVVDVVAGAVLAVAVPLCARALHPLMEPRLVRRWMAQLWSYGR